MITKIRINYVCRFLKIDMILFNTVFQRCNVENRKYRVVEFITINELKLFFEAYGLYLFELFINERNEKKKAHFENYKYPKKCELKELESEYKLLNSIAKYLVHKEILVLKRDIDNFENHSSFNESKEFINLKEYCNTSELNFIKIKEHIYYLSEYIQNIHWKQSLTNSIEKESDKPHNEKEFEIEEDDTDWEKIIMNAIRDGEQDRFGL
jgi:hypothetical protein